MTKGTILYPLYQTACKVSQGPHRPQVVRQNPFQTRIRSRDRVVHQKLIHPRTIQQVMAQEPLTIKDQGDLILIMHVVLGLGDLGAIPIGIGNATDLLIKDIIKIAQTA